MARENDAGVRAFIDRRLGQIPLSGSFLLTGTMQMVQNGIDYAQSLTHTVTKTSRFHAVITKQTGAAAAELDLDLLASYLISQGWTSATVSGDTLLVPAQGASWTRADLEAGNYNGVLPPLLNDVQAGVAAQGF